jgi:hypothetical protein
VGAVAILLPFALFQLGRLSPHSAPYLWLNLAGSALLTWAAWAHEQWGFLILQGVWTLVTLWSIGKLAGRGRADSKTAPP